MAASLMCLYGCNDSHNGQVGRRGNTQPLWFSPLTRLEVGGQRLVNTTQKDVPSDTTFELEKAHAILS